jgi:hypothetical protein
VSEAGVRLVAFDSSRSTLGLIVNKEMEMERDTTKTMLWISSTGTKTERLVPLDVNK